MSARMEQVREALDHATDGYPNRSALYGRALAEVEEWEAQDVNWRKAYDAINRQRLAAEAERDLWLTEFDGDGVAWHESLPSPYTYQASDFSKLVTAVHAYESRALSAEAERDRLQAALELASESLGDLTRPPFTEHTHAVAIVRDEVREALASIKSEGQREQAGTQGTPVALHQPHPVQEKPGTGAPSEATNEERECLACKGIGWYEAQDGPDRCSVCGREIRPL